MAAITGAVLAAGTAAFSITQGIKKNKEAKEALNDLDQPILDNVYKDLPISTVGSDYLAEQNARTSADLVGASRDAGIRGVLSGIPKIQAFTNDANREGQAYLDRQVQDRNRLIAGDEQRIQGTKENRYNNELAGIGNLMDVGQTYINQGVRGLGNAAMSYASNTPKNLDNLSKSGEYTRDWNFRSLNGMTDINSAYDGSYDVPRLSRESDLFKSYKPSPYGLS